MMIKSRLGKLVLTGILTLTVAVPTITFADDVINNGNELKKPFAIRNRMKDRRENISKIAQTTKCHRQAILKVVEKYAPEDLEQWNNLFKEHKEVREEIKSIMGPRKENRKENRQNITSEYKEARRAFINDLKAKIESGEITKKEARVQMQEYTQTRKNELKNKINGFKEKSMEWKENNQDEIDEWKESKEEYKALKQALAEAVQAEDKEQINGLLDQLFEKMQEKNENLKSKIEALKAKETI